MADRTVMPATAPPPTPDALAHAISETEQAVLDAVRATPYGSVEVVLHQARIVQVVRTQKLRLDGSAD